MPHSGEMTALLPRAVAGKADEAGLSTFGALWQDRVRRMLTEHADDPKLIHLHDWEQDDASKA